MDKWDKIKDIIGIGAKVTKPFVPGGIGDILDIVERGLDDKADPHNEQAIKALTDAVIALDKRVARLER